MKNHHQNIKTNRILIYIKVTVLLHRTHYLDRSLHGFGPILAFIQLWITVESICNHISFKILMHIQIVEHHKDRLSLIMIWSKVYLLMVKEVRTTRNKKTSVCSRVDVPQTYLTIKRGGCSGRASKNQWSNSCGGQQIPEWHGAYVRTQMWHDWED